jgi:hypothetical protein
MNGVPLLKNSRIYANGYDISGHARSFGPLATTFDEGEDNPLNAALKGVWLGACTISPGTINSIFDNTALTGIHALEQTPSMRTLLIAMGQLVPPVAGDIAFCGQFNQTGYQVGPTETPNTATIPFGGVHGTSVLINYETPWGVLAHAKAARTAANTATGIDQLAATALGGYMVYQVFDAVGAGNITATLKVQDASVNSDGSFGDLLSSGSINCGSGGVAVPTYGVVALAKTAAVKQFIRWQLALGTATSVTFALAFVRNFIP